MEDDSRVNYMVQNMKQAVKLVGTVLLIGGGLILFFIMILGPPIWHYEECIKVGHSKAYCLFGS